MSWMKAFSALTRWRKPSSSCFHSAAGKMRGIDIERDDALGASIVARHREGDAHAAKYQVGFSTLALDGLGALAVEPALEFLVVLARAALKISHLIVKARRALLLRLLL